MFLARFLEAHGLSWAAALIDRFAPPQTQGDQE